MKRRAFIMVAGTLLAERICAQAQPGARVARVGVLFPGKPDTSATIFAALTEGLRARGWRTGENLQFETRYANLELGRLPALAAELAALRPDVIVCSGPAPAKAISNLGVQIPVVFVVVADPVGLGLASSLARPGGMFTGLATMAPGLLFAKQLELLRESVPGARRIAFLINPDNPMLARAKASGPDAIKKQGLFPISVEARTKEQLGPAFADAARQRADLMFVGGDPLFAENRGLIAALALRHRMASMFLFSQHVDAGGLMSYGVETKDMYRDAAAYVDKILRGAAARDLPIEEPRQYMLVINQKTARSLGLAIPQSVLLRADRVIE